MDDLAPPRFLFRFSIPCEYRPELWTGEGVSLDEACHLPHLAEMDGSPTLAEVRAAWNEGGLAFTADVLGKRQPPWCRETQLDESDGLHLWIDTRDVRNVHRATRFCHRFVFLPTGGGSRRDEPVAGQLPIHRAREQAKPALARHLRVRSERRGDGYRIEAFIDAEGLTGFDVEEHPRLGFTYSVLDRERGPQSLSVGEEFRFAEDPSLWATLLLLR